MTTKKDPKSKAARKPKRVTANRPDEMQPDVLEFITAIDEYKRAHQRPFPTWSEVLDIVKSLGYDKART